MKRNAIVFIPLLLAVVFVSTLPERAWAQNTDTLDVAPGYETLNIAVSGDTLPGGILKNVNRVYRLARGGYYLLNGSVRGIGANHLRIVAAKGTGPRPLVIPTASQTGSSLRAFRINGSGTWKGLYVTGIDNLGNQAEDNMFRMDGTGITTTIDDCYLDGDAQSFVRMNAANQKLFVTNTIARNSFLMADPNNGRYWDTRSNNQDTILTQNCTLYMNSGDMVRANGGRINQIIWDHNTMMWSGSEFDMDYAINATVTNNLFVNFGFGGEVIPKNILPSDSVRNAIIQFDSLKVTGVVETNRQFKVTNNVYGWTPELTAWYDQVDTLDPWVWTNVRGKYFLKTFPNMVEQNNIMEYPVFSDPPDPAPALAYAKHRLSTNFSNIANPAPRLDRNGTGPMDTKPETVGPATNDHDFDYSKTSKAYTHAERGLPAGDLNWFPDKLAIWKLPTSVESGSGVSIPLDFTLEQNYPNPFNPTTMITYTLRTNAASKLTIYNVLGQKVRVLMNQSQPVPGTYSVQWNGRDDIGRSVASGMYIYRLDSGDLSLSKSMMLLK